MWCRILSSREIPQISSEDPPFFLKLSDVPPGILSNLKVIISEYIPQIGFFPAKEKNSFFLTGSFLSYQRLCKKLNEEGLNDLSIIIKNTLDNFQKKSYNLSFPSKSINLAEKVAVMGILNLTPDSFYDGGKYKGEKEILNRVEQMVEEGADIIDIGGESTRPGALPVTEKEEIKRVIPYIRKITHLFDIPVSIDTYKSKVAISALEEGAQMVNDISGLRFDPEMVKVVSSYNIPVVIMHIKGTPRNMQNNPRYESLMDEIISYLDNGIQRAVRAGIDPEKIIVDPGIGFGKTVEHNLFILKRLSELKVLGKPILIGVSRKSFIGKVLGLPVEKRLTGSLAASCIAVMEGARIVRTHDVKETRWAVDLVDAILKSKV